MDDRDDTWLTNLANASLSAAEKKFGGNWPRIARDPRNPGTDVSPLPDPPMQDLPGPRYSGDWPRASEAAATGGATVEVEVEWGLRTSPGSDRVHMRGSGPEAEKDARMIAPDYERIGIPRPLVRRTVTYGPWEEVPGDASV